MKSQKKPTSHRSTRSHKAEVAHARQPFIEHLQEARRRVYYVVISIALWGAAIYGVQQHVVNALVRPAKGQHFIYTSPGGGIDFLFRICIYGGIVLSLPVIVYNSLRFIEPLITKSSRKFIALGSLASGVLALGGVTFGYYIGLPAALHFLLHQFTTVQIQPLVTIQSYLGFVIVYMVGSAMLFQLPLMLLFINRVKPLKPKRLLHYERWVILAAFVLAGLMNPTPNVVSQLLVAGPFIVMYQLGILLIALVNRPKRSTQINSLAEQDRLAYARRQSIALTQLPFKPVMPLPTTVAPPLAARSMRRPMVSEVSPPAKRITQPTYQQVKRRTVQPNPRRQFIDFVPRGTIQSLAPEN